MSGEGTKGMKRIAQAMTPENPSARAKRALFEQVGRAIVRLSDVEMLLAMLFAMITPREPRDVAELFYDQGTLEKRIRLLDFMAEGELTDEEIRRWEKIRGAIKTHKGLRNLIAHQRLFVGQPDDAGEVQVSLQPPWLKKKGRKIDIAEIKKTADALDKIHGELWSFISSLHRK